MAAEVRRQCSLLPRILNAITSSVLYDEIHPRRKNTFAAITFDIALFVSASSSNHTVSTSSDKLSTAEASVADETSRAQRMNIDFRDGWASPTKAATASAAHAAAIPGINDSSSLISPAPQKSFSAKYSALASSEDTVILLLPVGDHRKD